VDRDLAETARADLLGLGGQTFPLPISETRALAMNLPKDTNLFLIS
jgi:hypothetical protein